MAPPSGAAARAQAPRASLPRTARALPATNSTLKGVTILLLLLLFPLIGLVYWALYPPPQTNTHYLNANKYCPPPFCLPVTNFWLDAIPLLLLTHFVMSLRYYRVLHTNISDLHRRLKAMEGLLKEAERQVLLEAEKRDMAEAEERDTVEERDTMEERGEVAWEM